jgi:hypothetical protein
MSISVQSWPDRLTFCADFPFAFSFKEWKGEFVNMVHASGAFPLYFLLSHESSDFCFTIGVDFLRQISVLDGVFRIYVLFSNLFAPTERARWMMVIREVLLASDLSIQVGHGFLTFRGDLLGHTVETYHRFAAERRRIGITHWEPAGHRGKET